MKWRAPLVDGEQCKDCTPRDGCATHPPEPEVGPHCKYTIASGERFLEAKRRGASTSKSCAAAGWSVEVYNKWNQEMRKGETFPRLTHFLMVEVPNAERVLYEKALEAIERGLDNPDPDKAANVGLKVLDKLYGRDLDPVSAVVKHEGHDGGPIEFRIVMDGLAKLPPLPAQLADDEDKLPASTEE